MCGLRARAVKLGARMYGHGSAGYAHVADGRCTSFKRRRARWSSSVLAVAASHVLAAASRAWSSAPLDSSPALRADLATEEFMLNLIVPRVAKICPTTKT